MESNARRSNNVDEQIMGRRRFGSLGDGFSAVLRMTRKNEEQRERDRLTTSSINKKELPDWNTKCNAVDGYNECSSFTTAETTSDFGGSIIAAQDTKQVHQGKVLLLTILLAAATTVSLLTFFLARNSQEDEFESKFATCASEVAHASQTSARAIFRAVGSLSFSMTSYAEEQNETFPFVTHPHFEILGEYAVQLSGSSFVAFVPLITNSTYQEWNQYSVQNQDWIQTSLELQHQTHQKDASEYDEEVEPIYPSIYYPDMSYGYKFENETINRGSWVKESPFSEDLGLYTPVWQVSPSFPEVSDYVNFNLMRHPTVPKFMPGMIQTGKPVITSISLPLGSKDHLEHLRKKAGKVDQSKGYRKLEAEEDLNDHFPHSILFHPVFDKVAQVGLENAVKTIGKKGAAVGAIMAVFPWDAFFTGILSNDDKGVVVVADDQCGKVFSFEINGPNIDFMGREDLHDSHYDDMVVTTTFDDLDSEGVSCKYLLSIYPSETFEQDYITNRPMWYAIIMASIFFVTALTFVLYHFLVEKRQRRAKKLFARMEAKNAAENALLMVQNANCTAKAERDLNDYIAHEVRNPLAAALSATSFVMSCVSENKPLRDPQTLNLIREDAGIIDSSLQFINELLRNMLDMHRAGSKQLKIEFNPADVLRDILEPVASMIYQRGGNFEVKCICPENLVVLTDKLRLKQVVLNLARNSSKFVIKGYICLRANILKNGTIQIAIEDSGPGVPEDKKNDMFCKYQESHDECKQGTGIGLSLCKNLTELMGCDLFLDNEFTSGIQGCPGARLVINLNVPELSIDAIALEKLEMEDAASTRDKVARSDGDSANKVRRTQFVVDPKTQKYNFYENQDLPEKLRVLQVEDDMILRKLFARSVKRVCPGWELFEVANGEGALRMVDEQDFDIIFMDQYMSSCSKQLLGTETVRMLRAKGVMSKISGLSANDVEQSFLEAGANHFIFKPFPSKEEPLKRELKQLMFKDAKGTPTTEKIRETKAVVICKSKQEEGTFSEHSEETVEETCNEDVGDDVFVSP